MCGYIKRLLINHWLMCLRSWSSPEICRVHWQVGDIWLASGAVPVWRLAGSKPKKSPHLKVITQEEVSLILRSVGLLVLSMPLTAWTWPTHRCRFSLLHSVYWVECSSLPTTLRNVSSNTWAPYGPVKLTHKTNCQSVDVLFCDKISMEVKSRHL